MPPLKLAILGAGPSAFYTASRLLSLLPQSHPKSGLLKVHMFDRLWAPHGLVRYGVAPDHPEVKNCTNKFDEAAKDPRFRFFGNVNVGSSPSPSALDALNLPLSALFQNYTHLLFATGCTLPTLHPAIPPSPYCIPALSLVHWYTQHPSNPPPPPLDKLSHVSIIGQGNVSLDVARILLTPPSVLAKYDVPQHVLALLNRSTVKHVSIIGRRGPFQAAFTTKELREMMNLPDASMVPIDPALLTPSPDTPVTRQQSRTIQLLKQGSKNPPGSTPKSWSLEFFRSPTGLTLPSPPSSPLATLTLAHTALDPATQRAVPTTGASELSTSLVVTSLGFHAEPADPALGDLRVLAGRVVGTTSDAPLRGVYASGWAATGAKGVLAATMINAYAVADTILSDHLAPESEDVSSSTPVVMNPDPHPDEPPREVLAAEKVTTYADWLAVDAEEVRRGAALGKERERMNWADARVFLQGLSR